MKLLQHFKDKNILIVGASSGIIQPLLPQLLSFGCHIHCFVRDIEKLKKIIGNEKRIQITAINLNEIPSKLDETLPSFDGIVFAAGVLTQKPFKFTRAEELRYTFNINFFSQMELLQKLFTQGKINVNSSVVFISSLASKKSDIGLFGYSASKGAIDSAIKGLAIELGKNKKIRINSVCPAVVQTNLLSETQNKIGEEALKDHLSNYILGEIAPADICDSILFLLSNMSRKITGQSLIIDSGLTC
jgi:NAD(P)-dependent dehydrogenase (short-subunit alcohol dehydrogenase family)